MIDLEHDLHHRLVAMADAIPVEPALDRVVDVTDRPTIVPLTPRATARPRRSLIAVSLAAAAALTAVLVVLPRGRDEAPGAVTPVQNYYFPIVSELPSGLEGPVTAGLASPANPPGYAVTEAVIGRRDASSLRGYIGISVATADVDLPGTVGAVQADHSASGALNRASILVQPRLSVIVWGTAPPEQLRATLDEVTPTATRAPLAFTLPVLPAGYELIADVPAHLVSTSPVPDLSTDVSRSTWVDVGVDLDPLPPLPDNLETAAAVDIDGHAGWVWTDRADPQLHVVAWEAAPGVKVYVQGHLSADQAVAVARGLRFTDEATWREHYRMFDPPLGPTTTTIGG